MKITFNKYLLVDLEGPIEFLKESNIERGKHDNNTTDRIKHALLFDSKEEAENEININHRNAFFPAVKVRSVKITYEI